MNNDLSTLSDKALQEELKKREAQKQKEQAERKTKHHNEKLEFLASTIGEFENHNKSLKALKERTITKANQLWQEMYAIQGKESREQKQITVKEGDYKIVVERQDKMVFTDEAMVHIDAIKEIMKTKFETRNKGMYEFLDSILMKNGAGDYDPKLLTKAKKKAIELGYEDLIIELDKLQNCQTVQGSAMYCRAYKKNEKGAFKDIVIQFSAL